MNKPVSILLLLVMVSFSAIAVRANGEEEIRSCAKPFFAVGTSMRSHFAFSGFQCPDSVHSKCESTALNTKAECVSEGGDGGTTYSSCYCQSVRAARQCYADNGCFNMSFFLVQDAEECFFQ